MDYENPFSAVNPQSFAGNPSGPGFVNQWETGAATEKSEMAKPFIQNMFSRDIMELAKKKMETGEFMDPAAAKLRKDKQALESEQTASKRQMVDPQLKADIAEAETKMRTFGPEADAKIAQSRKIVQDIKDAPIQKMLREFGDYSKTIDDVEAENKKKGLKPLDGFTKKDHYDQFVKNFKEQHPDLTIPPNLEHWSANTDKYLATNRLMALHSIDHEQKMEIQKEKDKSDERSASIHAGATVAAAGIAATQSGKNTETVAGSKEEREMGRKVEAVNRAEEKARGDLAYMRLKTPDERSQYLDMVKQRALSNYNDVTGGNMTSGSKGSQEQQAVKQGVESSGYSFEPDKFEYRKNPQTGIWQRKPK